MATSAEELPTLRDFASSEPRLRRHALQTVLAHLESRQTPLTPIQSLQLWRAFFVSLLMHDSKSAVSVQNLIVTLAGSLGMMAHKDDDAEKNTESDLDVFTTAFWETISSEWGGVDVHRMDKMLLLIRMVLRQLFEICLSPSPSLSTSSPSPTSTSERDGRKAKILHSQLSIFSTWPLSPRERKVPDGLRYHVLDIWVDELARARDGANAALASEDDPAAVDDVEASVKLLVGPVERLAKEGLSKGVRIRAKETLADARERLGFEGGG